MALPRGAMGLSAVYVVVFPDHTHLLFLALRYCFFEKMLTPNTLFAFLLNGTVSQAGFYFAFCNLTNAFIMVSSKKQGANTYVNTR